MSTEIDVEDAARLRRVRNRSAVIQEERRRRTKQRFTVGGAGLIVVAVAVVGAVVTTRSTSTPLRSTSAGNTRPATTTGGNRAGSGGVAAGFVWESGVLGASVAGPAYGAGRVFVMTADRSVMAIDPASGAVVWTHAIVVAERDALAKTTATVDYAGGLVIAAGPDVPLQALDARTGNVRWTTAGTSPTPAARGVAVVGDVVAAANSTGVSAFDVTTGEPRWAAHVAASHGAAGRGSLVVALTDDGGAVALDRVTGAVRWAAPLPVPATARPTFESDSVVVVVDDNGGLHRLSTTDGRMLTTVQVATCRPCTLPSQPLASQPSVVAGRIVVGTPTGVVGVDPVTSSVVWTYATPGPVVSSPVPAGRSSVVVGVPQPDRLLELDAVSGKVVASTALPAPAAGWALALDSRFVVTTLDGRVRAVRR